jgi:cob(I)alamin adenosyltransferase
MDAAMSNRLSQIATRTGDDGTTGLGDGLARAQGPPARRRNGRCRRAELEPRRAAGRAAARRTCASCWSSSSTNSSTSAASCRSPATASSRPKRWRALDAALARHNAALPRLAEFILPAGTRSAALAHVSRTIARRAERAVVALAAAGEPVHDAPRQYLNRLSDLMFVLARVLNRANLDGLGGDDVYWKSEKLARAQGEQGESPS